MLSSRALASMANNSSINATARTDAASCLLIFTASKNLRRECAQHEACTIFSPPTRSRGTASHAELEDRRTSRRSVLPQIGLMICAPAIVSLHIDWSFIRLDVASRKQLTLHRSNHRHQHLSDGHHPAAHL